MFRYQARSAPLKSRTHQTKFAEINFKLKLDLKVRLRRRSAAQHKARQLTWGLGLAAGWPSYSSDPAPERDVARCWISFLAASQ